MSLRPSRKRAAKPEQSTPTYRRMETSSALSMGRFRNMVSWTMFDNAGIVIGGEARDLTLEQWRPTLDVDFSGVLHGTLAAYSVMVKQGSGHIVNTSSVAGLMPQPRNAPYSTAKHAIVGLSLSLRLEGADLGVKVGVVCPGFVRTNIYQNAVRANVSKEQVIAPLSQRKMVEASEAARLILDGAARNRSIIEFPARIRWTGRLDRLFLGILDGVMLGRARKFRSYRSVPFTPPHRRAQRALLKRQTREAHAEIGARAERP